MTVPVRTSDRIEQDPGSSRIRHLAHCIVSRVGQGFRRFGLDDRLFAKQVPNEEKLNRFYAFYGVTPRHPVYFSFKHSSLAGSCFLGRCKAERSIIYKSDIRGDELKRKDNGTDNTAGGPLMADEVITIQDSLLYKTLVHGHSHNPGSPETLLIQNTVSAHHANIHGSTLVGCYLSPFATVDRMTLHSCILGTFSCVQAEELFHQRIDPGTVWIRTPEFEFRYRFEKDFLDTYAAVGDAGGPKGVLHEFAKQHEKEYQRLFDVIRVTPLKIPESSSVSRYAVVKGQTLIGKNVLVAQRAFLDHAVMGDGANAQENAYIIHSRLKGLNVTTHGAKVIHADVGKRSTIGFNAFLYGKAHARLRIGDDCIIMPHTIIDAQTAIDVPAGHLIWGGIRTRDDLKTHTLHFAALERVSKGLDMGNMTFKGSGEAFMHASKARIRRVLMDNGAFFSAGGNRGHAQNSQEISYNILQPYRTGGNKGVYPSIRIEP